MRPLVLAPCVRAISTRYTSLQLFSMHLSRTLVLLLSLPLIQSVSARAHSDAGECDTTARKTSGSDWSRVYGQRDIFPEVRSVNSRDTIGVWKIEGFLGQKKTRPFCCVPPDTDSVPGSILFHSACTKDIVEYCIFTTLRLPRRLGITLRIDQIYSVEMFLGDEDYTAIDTQGIVIHKTN